MKNNKNKNERKDTKKTQLNAAAKVGLVLVTSPTELKIIKKKNNGHYFQFFYIFFFLLKAEVKDKNTCFVLGNF